MSSVLIRLWSYLYYTPFTNHLLLTLSDSINIQWYVYRAMETMHVEWFGSVDIDLIFCDWRATKWGRLFFFIIIFKSFLFHYHLGINGV